MTFTVTSLDTPMWPTASDAEPRNVSDDTPDGTVNRNCVVCASPGAACSKPATGRSNSGVPATTAARAAIGTRLVACTVSGTVAPDVRVVPGTVIVTAGGGAAVTVTVDAHVPGGPRCRRPSL